MIPPTLLEKLRNKFPEFEIFEIPPDLHKYRYVPELMYPASLLGTSIPYIQIYIDKTIVDAIDGQDHRFSYGISYDFKKIFVSG